MANIEFTTPKDFIIYMNVIVDIFLHFHHTDQIIPILAPLLYLS